MVMGPPSSAAWVEPLSVGGGNRVCIGQHMATQELMMIFATLLQRSSIMPTPDNNPRMEVGRV
jgi:cytochrome P450